MFCVFAEPSTMHVDGECTYYSKKKTIRNDHDHRFAFVGHARAIKSRNSNSKLWFRALRFCLRLGALTVHGTCGGRRADWTNWPTSVARLVLWRVSPFSGARNVYVVLIKHNAPLTWCDNERVFSMVHTVMCVGDLRRCIMEFGSPMCGFRLGLFLYCFAWSIWKSMSHCYSLLCILYFDFVRLQRKTSRHVHITHHLWRCLRYTFRARARSHWRSLDACFDVVARLFRAFSRTLSLYGGHVYRRMLLMFGSERRTRLCLRCLPPPKCVACGYPARWSLCIHTRAHTHVIPTSNSAIHPKPSPPPTIRPPRCEEMLVVRVPMTLPRLYTHVGRFHSYKSANIHLPPLVECAFRVTCCSWRKFICVCVCLSKCVFDGNDG